MFSTIIYFLPCLVSLLWFLRYISRNKSERQTLFMVNLALYAFYFATFALYISPSTDYKSMVYMDAVNIPVILVLLAVVVLYLHFHYKNVRFKGAQTVLLIPAIITGTIVNLLYYIIGFDNAAKLIELTDKGEPIPAEYMTDIYRMYNFFAEPFVNVCAGVFNVAIFTMGILIVRKEGYRFGDLSRFLFCGMSLGRSGLVATLTMLVFALLLPMLLMGRRFMFHHEYIGMTMSATVAFVLHCMSYVEFYSSQSRIVCLHDLLFLQTEKSKEERVDGIINNGNDGDKDVDEGAEVKIDSIVNRRKTEQEKKLRQLFEVDKIYLDESLTSCSVADMLGISRTSISSLVASTYGMTFREVVAHYRIEHVKQFMLSNPTATQETAASMSGFKTAQYLNHKFKEMEGKTPSMWLAMHGNE